jgi:ribosome modulation factor
VSSELKLKDVPLPTTREDGKSTSRAMRGAWRKGYFARLTGEPRSTCPYDETAISEYNAGRCGPNFNRGFATRWQAGWDAADRGDGIPGHPDYAPPKRKKVRGR